MLRCIRTDCGPLEYTLMQTGRQSIELRVLPEEIRLFTPKAYPLRSADAYVAAHMDFIRDAQARLTAYADRERAAFPMTDGMIVPVEGRHLALHLHASQSNDTRIEGNSLIISGPCLEPDAVSAQLHAFLVKLAHARLNERLEYYIPLIGRRPNRVSVREQRTKWGSCSNRGSISFNWKLIMAPSEALDYVVIHELCHLYEFNHSEKFWQRVARFQPDYAHWRDFLRSGWNHPFR